MSWVIIIILGLFFTVFSGSILAYISVATMIGPWMAPTIALLTNVLFKGKQRLCGSKHPIAPQQSTALIQAIGAVGGAIATGIGFAFPTLYFLDRTAFNQLLANPGAFCLIIMLLCLTAGTFGITIGSWITKDFIEKKALGFPVSQLTHKVICAQHNREQATGIFKGITLATAFALIRDGIGAFGGFIPKTIYFFTPVCAVALWPTIWAIGFSSGTGLIAPMLLGLVSKYLVLFPINNHAQYLPVNLFQPMNIISFTVAFCSGIVISEVIQSICKNIYYGFYIFKRWRYEQPAIRLRKFIKIKPFQLNKSDRSMLILSTGVLASTICFLTWLKFPLSAQVTLLAATTFTTYQICFIGGNIGLIQYGRFSTYILVPMYLFFNLSALQLTIVCTFFNICAATASDLLFDIKTGDLCQVDRHKMWRVQWIGLAGTALFIGIIFYMLFTNLQLGSPDFFAQRSQAKALLIQTLHFDFWVVCLGFLYGTIIKRFGLSPTMVFGGIIMPNSISIGLIIGASLTLLTHKREAYLPFCAGIFASESLLVLVNILIKML